MVVPSPVYIPTCPQAISPINAQWTQRYDPMQQVQYLPHVQQFYTQLPITREQNSPVATSTTRKTRSKDRKVIKLNFFKEETRSVSRKSSKSQIPKKRASLSQKPKVKKNKSAKSLKRHTRKQSVNSGQAYPG